MIGLLVALTISTAGLRGTPVTFINGPSFQTAYELVTTFFDAITAFLLMVQFRQTGFLPLACLSAGYMFSGIMAASHLLSIPGLLLAPNIFGATVNTQFLLRVCWMAGQPIGAIAYVATARLRPKPVAHIGRTIAATVCLVALAAAAILELCTQYPGSMPDLTDKAENWATTYLLVLPILLAIQLTALSLMGWATRGRTILTLWVIVALFSGLTETVIGWWLVGIGMPVGRRYSLLFYVARIAGMLSSCLLLLVMLHQIAALYARLVTALRSLEASERRLVAQQRMEAVGRMAGGIAHDFNNLLTVISGNLYLLRNAVPEQRQRHLIDTAVQAAERGSNLTRQMLTFARRQMLRPGYFDIDALLDEAQPLLQSAAEARITVHRIRGSVPMLCHIDRAEFELALLNIVVNARQAMPAGGTITIRSDCVEIPQSGPQNTLDPELPPGRYARITFSDTGTGMDVGTLASAFEPFFTTRPVGEGTGLGLKSGQWFRPPSRRRRSTLKRHRHRHDRVAFSAGRRIAGATGTATRHQTGTSVEGFGPAGR